jgi:hypothetical protein
MPRTKLAESRVVNRAMVRVKRLWKSATRIIDSLKGGYFEDLQRTPARVCCPGHSGLLPTQSAA